MRKSNNLKECFSDINSVLCQIAQMMGEAGATLPKTLGNESYLVDNNGIVKGVMCNFDNACTSLIDDGKSPFKIDACFDSNCATFVVDSVETAIREYENGGCIWTDVDPRMIGKTIDDALIYQALPNTEGPVEDIVVEVPVKQPLEDTVVALPLNVTEDEPQEEVIVLESFEKLKEELKKLLEEDDDVENGSDNDTQDMSDNNSEDNDTSDNASEKTVE